MKVFVWISINLDLWSPETYKKVSRLYEIKTRHSVAKVFWLLHFVNFYYIIDKEVTFIISFREEK